MIGLLLALYPAPWRRRYGEEFRAVLEARPLGPFDVADVVLGALDARLAPRLSETASKNGGQLTMLRLGGYGAVIGGVMWFLGIAIASATGGAGAERALLLFIAGNVGILLALVGLSAFQAQRQPRLAWAAFAIPAMGTIVSVIGSAVMVLLGDVTLVDGWSGWSIWFVGLLTTLAGSALFALATIRAAVLSRPAAIVLAVSTIATLVISIAGIGAPMAPDVVTILSAVSLFAFGGSWVALGMSALRRGPIRAVAPV